MHSLSFLEVPFSGTQSILNFFQTHSDEICVPELTHSEHSARLIVQGPEEFHSVTDPDRYLRKGIFLTDPALRLARAYIGLNKTEQVEVSFECFYRDKRRQNLYSSMLQGLSLEDLGIVGVDKYVNLSILLISEFLALSKPLECNFLNPHDSDAYALLNESNVAEIQRLNESDYLLYQAALNRVKQRYLALEQPVTTQLPKGKRVFIHVGPSKTGSSAIQSMLHEQKLNLENQQFYYPEHAVDQNAISSGNYAHLLSQKGDTNEYVFDIQKCKKLIEDFGSVDSSTLLLSSERFENCLFSLLRAFETATIIYYVRFPAAQFESGYHQQVKRHGRTSPFQLPSKWRLTQLELLLQLANELDRNVLIRFYDSTLNSTNSLLEDFSEAIGFSMEKQNESKRINARLDFPALELIRYCNEFLTREEIGPLEQTLQSTSKRDSRFTLIAPQQLEALNSVLVNDIEILIKRFPMIENNPALITQFRALSKMRIDYPHFVQADARDSLKEAWLSLKSTHVSVARDIYIKQQMRSNASVPVLEWSLVDSIRLCCYKLAGFMSRLLSR